MVSLAALALLIGRMSIPSGHADIVSATPQVEMNRPAPVTPVTPVPSSDHPSVPTQSSHKINQSSRYSDRRVVEPVHQLSDLQWVQPNATVIYHGTILTRLNTRTHYRYFWIIKPVLAHRDITSVGSRRDYDLVLRPSRHLTIPIRRIWQIHSRHGYRIRYQVRIHGKAYFVSGNSHYVQNSYYQPKQRYFRIRVTRTCNEYSHRQFNRRTRIRVLRPGQTLRVKNVIYLGRKAYRWTRFVLANGHYITANKNFVTII